MANKPGPQETSEQIHSPKYWKRRMLETYWPPHLPTERKRTPGKYRIGDKGTLRTPQRPDRIFR